MQCFFGVYSPPGEQFCSLSIDSAASTSHSSPGCTWPSTTHLCIRMAAFASGEPSSSPKAKADLLLWDKTPLSTLAETPWKGRQIKDVVLIVTSLEAKQGVQMNQMHLNTAL